MMAGQPLGIEQDEIAWTRHGHMLMHVEDAASDIARIDGQLDCARKSDVARRRDRVYLRTGRRPAIERRDNLRMSGAAEAG